jgi:hypothetical protein
MHRAFRTGVLMLAAGAVMHASAQAPMPALTTVERNAVEGLTERLKADMALPERLALDGSLRTAASQMADAHVSRMRGVFQSWVVQQRPADGTPNDEPRALSPLFGRYVNELAQAWLQSPGREYDETLMPALLRPGICLRSYDMPLFAAQMALIQAVAPDRRSVLLDGERTLLARWGQPRPDLPPRPEPGQRDLEEANIARLQAGQEVAAPPMPPVLAAAVLKDQRDRLSDGERCALRQWGLATALSLPGARPADALHAYRFAAAFTAQDAFAPLENGIAARAGSQQDYPLPAQFFEVEGKIQVEIEADVQGRLLHARIKARDIKVPGLHGARPVAFDTVLDEASLARARLAWKKPPATSTPRDGHPIQTLEFVWRLE